MNLGSAGSMEEGAAAGVDGELQLRMREATELTDTGRWDDAFGVLRELEDQYPRDATLLCLLGSVSQELGAVDQAYDYYQRCLAEQPRDPMVLVTAGAALSRYDAPEAEGALRMAALTAPELAVAHLYYGAYLAREGLTEEALSELETAHRLEPDEPRASRELGIAYLLAGRTGEALRHLGEAVAGGAEEPEARLLLGLALVQAGQGEDAAEELHRAALELAADGEVQLVAALACAGRGWEGEAWDALARAEGAELPADPLVLREAEEMLEAGAEAAESFLQEQVAPSVLRERLAERL